MTRQVMAHRPLRPAPDWEVHHSDSFYDCEKVFCSCFTSLILIPTGPGSVTINVQANDKSALVSWNVTPQDACSGAAVNYTIFYSTEEGPELGKSSAVFFEVCKWIEDIHAPHLTFYGISLMIFF